MVTMTFREFMKGDYEEPLLITDSFKLYVLSDSSDNCLYVGISTANIWNRWFNNTFSHIGTNIYKELFGNSNVGLYVVANIPKSLDWNIHLYSLIDCRRLLNDKRKMPIHEVEPRIIKKLRPSMNVEFNCHG